MTATSDGAATGISVTRGNTIFASLTAGAGGADLVSKGTVTANSTSAAAIGVSGVFVNDATNAATLSLRTEGNVIANGTAAGSYGIFAQRGGTRRHQDRRAGRRAEHGQSVSAHRAPRPAISSSRRAATPPSPA